MGEGFAIKHRALTRSHQSQPMRATTVLWYSATAAMMEGVVGFHATPCAAGRPLARAGLAPGVPGCPLRARAPQTPALARATRRQRGTQAPRMFVMSALPIELPVLAIKAVMATAHPLLVDSLFAGLLYVLGKATSSTILGRRESGVSLQKWFICGLADGLASHAWYSFLEAKFAFITSNVHRALAMNSMSMAFFTPAYCAGFLILLSLLEGKGVRGAMDRLRTDGTELITKSVQVWGAINMPLFILVPLHLRVMVSMGFHYVYLVCLALWDANSRKAANAGELSEAPLVPAVEMIAALQPLSRAVLQRTLLDHKDWVEREPEDGVVRETAWGFSDEPAHVPALSLAVAKVPLVDLGMPHQSHRTPPIP